MFDYKEQILEFLKLNFNPSNPEEANFKVTSSELLNYLFDIYPVGCISDYDLNDILIKLEFKPYTYANTDKQLVFGWCMITDKIPLVEKINL